MAGRRGEKALRVAGGAALLLAIVLVFPCQGEGANDSHEPGLDAVRWLSWQHPVHVFALALAVVGVLALVAAWLLDSRQ
jgi:hypothetical protein